jgi:hypothetical protein
LTPLDRGPLTPRQVAYRLRFDALVLHCPKPQRSPDNPFHVEWQEACRTFFADHPVRALRPVQDLTFVTINTRAQPALLERCFSHLGLPLVVLGRGIPDWSWSYKITLVHSWLASGGCPTSHLVYLDGDDVLLIGEPELLWQRYLEIGSDLLFCNTRGDWPPNAECTAFEDQVNAGGDPTHRRLNAGGWIGEARYIGARLDEIVSALASREPWCQRPSGFDDQLAWRQLHRREHPRMQVDASCRIFLRFDEDR